MTDQLIAVKLTSQTSFFINKNAVFYIKYDFFFDYEVDFRSRLWSRLSVRLKNEAELNA